MRAGSLKERITIQKTATVVDADGGITNTYTTHATVYAAVEPLSGKELMEAKQIEAAASVRFRLRYRAGITTKMRVSYDSRFFDIHYVQNVGERKKQINLLCSERPA